MSTAPNIINRIMSRSDRSERFPLRQVREHRKYHFLVDSSTSTSNDTTANHDDDTTATSFTTVASDIDDGAFSGAVAATAGQVRDPEPIFAVPTLCPCGQVSVLSPGETQALQGERGLKYHDPALRGRGRGGGGGGRGGERLSFAVSVGGSSAQSSSSYSSGAHAPVILETKATMSSSSSSKSRTIGGESSSSGQTSERRGSGSQLKVIPRTRRHHGEKLTTVILSADPQAAAAAATITTLSSTSPTTTTTTTTTATSSASPTDTDTTTSAGNSPTAASSSTTKAGISPILLLWSLLTVLVAGTCTFAFLQPFWVMHVDLVHTFGMVSYCFMETGRQRPSREVCSAYGGYHHLANIPSGAWQAGCVLYGAGCVLLCVSSFLALSNLGMAEKHVPRVSLVAGYLQAIAVLTMIAGLLIFPLGFGSSFFRHYCGDFASAYNTGHCLIGWSYMLGIMGTALSVFCPFLSQFTDMRARDIFS